MHIDPKVEEAVRRMEAAGPVQGQPVANLVPWHYPPDDEHPEGRTEVVPTDVAQVMLLAAIQQELQALGARFDRLEASFRPFGNGRAQRRGKG